MSYFDQKEEVIDVQLTQFGKYLLSVGKFKPAYYSFHDSGILYDGQCAGLDEEQNAIIDRIKNNTPRNKTQYVFKGVDTGLLQQKKIYYDVNKSYTTQNQIDKYLGLSAPLGTSEYSSVYQPALSVKFLHGQLTGSLQYITSSFQTLKIPNIQSEIKYTINVEQDYLDIQQDPESLVKLDTVPGIDIVDDYLLLQIEELNSEFQNKNFDLEVFELDLSGNMLPLSFSRISSETNDRLDSSYVEYFLDIKIDNEVDNDTLCAVAKPNVKNIFVDNPNNCVADVVQENIQTFDEEEPSKEC